MKQGSSVLSSHVVQFSTLENWEKLDRIGMQVASHSELFLVELSKLCSKTLCVNHLYLVYMYLCKGHNSFYIYFQELMLPVLYYDIINVMLT